MAEDRGQLTIKEDFSPLRYGKSLIMFLKRELEEQ